MVREIIHLQVGQGGNQTGNAFWNSCNKEHSINAEGHFVDESAVDSDGNGIPEKLEKVDVYYQQTGVMDHKKESKWVPRAVVVDLEPGTIDVIKASPLGTLFNPDNMVFGANGAGNNWAKGHYTEGAELVESVLDVLRKEAEKGDCVQGFQLFHSVGGGTGSGMGTLLLLKLRDAHPDKITTTYSIYPSKRVSDVVVEPYNGVLSTHQLLENADQTFMIDNEALYRVTTDLLKISEPTYAVLNHLIAVCTCGITSSLRFPGKLNGDLRKLGTNLVPFPRLHFFNIAYAPLAAEGVAAKMTLSVTELTKQCFGKKNMLCNIDPTNGKMLAVSCVYRGMGLSTQDVDDNIKRVQENKAEEFVEWIPNNMKSSIVNCTPVEAEMDCTNVINTTALKEVFQRLATQFGAMYKRKAFLHWYKGEGMDEMEFQEADKNLRDLITEYQDKQDAVYEEEDEENDDEDDDLN